MNVLEPCCRVNGKKRKILDLLRIPYNVRNKLSTYQVRTFQAYSYVEAWYQPSDIE